MQYLNCTVSLVLNRLEFFKLANLYLNIFIINYQGRVFNNYFTTTSILNPYPVRSAANVRVAFARTNSRMFSIKCVGPRTWNDIPLTIRNLTNISLFKIRLRSQSHLIT